MSPKHLNLNRPVHLARRDAFFEKAVELLHMSLSEMDVPLQLKHVEQVISLLQSAENHASFAAQSEAAAAREPDFVHFLRLISQNAQSVHAMMQHGAHLEEEESFLCQFLGATQEQCALPAMAYRRRAEDILQGLWHVLRLANTSYRSLQQENLGNLSDDDKARYEKAAQMLRDELRG